MEVAWIEYKPRPPKKPRGYGLSNLVGDLVLTFATSGLWAIWWIIREVRR
jgi:hypothetical protein